MCNRTEYVLCGQIRTSWDRVPPGGGYDAMHGLGGLYSFGGAVLKCNQMGDSYRRYLVATFHVIVVG